MASIHFRKEGEKSQKTHKPMGTYRKRWKVAFILSGVLNVLFAYFIYNFFIK